jgi:uncharacterized protein (TIGR02246 family)
MVKGMRALALLVVAGCGAGSTAPPAAPASTCGATADQMVAARNEIAQTDQRGVEAIARHDMATYALEHAPDMLLFDADSATPTDTATFHAQMQRDIEKIKSFTETIEEIEIYGDAAYEMGRERAIGVDGQEFFGFKFVAVWKRPPGGHWKAYRVIVTGIGKGEFEPKPFSPVAAPAGCAEVPSTERTAAVRRQIEASVARGVQAVRGADGAAYAAGFTADGAYFSGARAEPIRGRAAIQEYIQGFAAKVTDRKMSTREVEVYGDVAYEAGAGEMTLAGDRYHGWYITIWKEQADGTWLAYRHMPAWAKA